MKKMRKALAIVLTLVLSIGALPMTAFAASADFTETKIKGVATGLKATDLVSDLTRVVSGTKEIGLIPAVLEDTVEKIAETTGTTPATGIRYLTAAQDKAIVDAIGSTYTTTALLVTAVSTAGSDAASAITAIAAGNYIWVLDSETGSEKALRILINQASDGTIEGGSTVKNPIYNVVLPTIVDFAINPLQIGDVTVGSQITTADYRVANKSNAPVKVSFNITAIAPNVTFVVDTDDLEPSNTVNPAKKIYFAALGADSITTSVTAPTFASTTLGTMNYNADKDGTLVPFDATNKKATISFLLGSATESNPGTSGIDTLAASNKGVASFQFYGELNTYAKWSAGDITVSGGYTLQGIKNSDYTTDSAKNVGLNVGQYATADGSEDNPYIAYPGRTLAISGATAGTAADIYVKLSGASAEDTITFAQIEPSFNYVAGTGYTWDKATQTIHIIQAWGSTGSKPNVVTVGNKSYTLNVTVAAAAAE